MSKEKTYVSLVVPFYNEGKAISKFYTEITELFRLLRDNSFEVLCIDDGSKDDILNQLLEIRRVRN